MRLSLLFVGCASLLAVVGCGPTITQEVKPVIDVSHSGIFSIDTVFDLKQIEVVEMSDGSEKSKTAAALFTLHEVKLNVEVLYDHGPPQKEDVFWANWKPGEQKTFNSPARGRWEGVNIKGKAIVMNGGSRVGEIDISRSWRSR